MKRLILIFGLFLFIHSAFPQRTSTLLFKNDNKWVFSQDFHPYKNLLASFYEDRKIEIFDTKTKIHKKTLYTQATGYTVKFSPLGSYLVASDSEKALYIWNTNNNFENKKIIEFDNPISDFVIDRNENFIYSVSQNGNLYSTDLSNFETENKALIEENVSKIDIYENKIFISTRSGNIYYYNPLQNYCVSIMKYNDSSEIIAFKVYDKYIYWAKQNGIIDRFDLISEEFLQVTKMITKALNAFCLLSQLYITGNSEGELIFCNRFSNEILYTLKFNCLINSIAVSKDDLSLSVSLADGSLNVVDLRKITKIQSYLPLVFSIKNSTSSNINKKLMKQF